MPALSASVQIAMAGFQRYAVGDTIEERFKNIVRPENVEAACWMTTNPDEQFRAAVGALMLSYGEGTPEFERIEAEMRAVNRLSAMINAAEAGLVVSAPEMEEGFEPIGLLGLWQKRK